MTGHDIISTINHHPFSFVAILIVLALLLTAGLRDG